MLVSKLRFKLTTLIPNVEIKDVQLETNHSCMPSLLCDPNGDHVEAPLYGCPLLYNKTLGLEDHFVMVDRCMFNQLLPSDTLDHLY